MIAAKILGYYWIDVKNNHADIVSKHLLKPLLFYSGNTHKLLDIDE
jgi:hypothetical protein